MEKRFYSVCSAGRSMFCGKDVFIIEGQNGVFFGDKSDYIADFKNHIFTYNNMRGSLVKITENERLFSILSGGEYCITQAEMIEKGIFKKSDFSELARVIKTLSGTCKRERDLTFWGVPFSA